MRYLLLKRGVLGCVKSSFIKLFNIDEDILNLMGLLLATITSFCLVIGGYKLFCFIETLSYPSINDNVSIGKCGIHGSYCIVKTDKPFSYSLGKSKASCYCCFFWNCKTIFENDAEYELAKQKFELLEKEKEITEHEWKIFKNWIKENKDKKFYAMYKSYSYQSFKLITEYKTNEYPVNAGRGGIIWLTNTGIKSVKSIPYEYTELIEEVIPTYLIDESDSNEYKDQDFNGMYVEQNFDKKRYKGKEKKYFEDINWYLMKEVDPITYFAKIELKYTRGVK